MAFASFDGALICTGDQISRELHAPRTEIRPTEIVPCIMDRSPSRIHYTRAPGTVPFRRIPPPPRSTSAANAGRWGDKSPPVANHDVRISRGAQIFPNSLNIHGIYRCRMIQIKNFHIFTLIETYSTWRKRSSGNETER